METDMAEFQPNEAQRKFLLAAEKTPQPVPWHVWEDVRPLDARGLVSINTRRKVWLASTTREGSELLRRVT